MGEIRDVVYRVHGMARGVLVLDENLFNLKPGLIEGNMHVVSVPAGMTDEHIIQTLLPHRIFVTQNSKDFMYDALIREYGIISLDKLRFIDPVDTARLISKVLAKRSLWAQRKPWLCSFSADGRQTTFKRITG